MSKIFMNHAQLIVNSYYIVGNILNCCLIHASNYIPMQNQSMMKIVVIKRSILKEENHVHFILLSSFSANVLNDIHVDFTVGTTSSSINSGRI